MDNSINDILYRDRNGETIHLDKPQIKIVDAKDINNVWDKGVNKEDRYRYVIDGATI